MHRRLIVSAAAAALGVSQLTAATTWKGDKVHSSVKFTVPHLLILQISGPFKDLDVTATKTGDNTFKIAGEKVKVDISFEGEKQ